MNLNIHKEESDNQLLEVSPDQKDKVKTQRMHKNYQILEEEKDSEEINSMIKDFKFSQISEVRSLDGQGEYNLQEH